MTPRRTPRWLHLPLPLLLLGAGMVFGYKSCEEDYGFDLIILGPEILQGFLILAGLSTAVIVWRTPEGWRIRVGVLHVLILALAVALLRETPPLGRWLWEQHVLRPRAASLRRYALNPPTASGQPFMVDGHHFRCCERLPEGLLFYTIVLGGPFCSTGIFVPFADDDRGFEPPQGKLPNIASSVKPTSVRGLYWLVTKD